MDDRPQHVTILDVRRRHEDGENTSKDVDQNVPFAAFDLLSRVEALRRTHLCALSTLAIENSQCRLLLAALKRSQLATKHVRDALECAVVTPLDEVAIDGLPRRKVVRQELPLQSRAINVQDRVKNLALAVLDVLRNGSVLWNVRLDLRPLCVGQVRRVRTAARTDGHGTPSLHHDPDQKRSETFSALNA